MPSDERLRREDWDVVEVPLSSCHRIVQAEHYTGGGANTATYRHGLVLRADPLRVRGIAWWIPPTKAAAIASWDGDWRRVLALTRLAIEPDVPRNAASFLLARSEKLIRTDGRFRCLVTYADEGEGHTGAIYRAANWEYVGLTGAEMAYEDGDGRRVSRKAGPRTRTHQEMLDLGYRAVGRSAKHKFRKILSPPRSRGGRLFEVTA